MFFESIADFQLPIADLKSNQSEIGIGQLETKNPALNIAGLQFV
jgi:hypothetical protein